MADETTSTVKIPWITLVSNNERNRRYDLCQACEHLTEMKTCTHCDCIMPVKTVWADAECPIGKWDKVPY